MADNKPLLDPCVGLRTPAEWEPHAGTLLAWPHNAQDWPGKFHAIPWVFCEIIRHITPNETVYLITGSEKQRDRARAMMSKAGIDHTKVAFVLADSNRGWMRDCSPAFVKTDGAVTAVQFDFNAWAKYDNWNLDVLLAPRIAHELQFSAVAAEHRGRKVVLEGGAIDINGQGTLVTTEECLLDKHTQVRNPGFSHADYEAVFRKYLGVQSVIWLGKGIAGDDTHGHVDDLCRFVNAKTLVLCHENYPRDDNYAVLMENWERLQDARLADGARPEVISLPMPNPLYFNGVRVPASYANFYICNELVLVPTFNDEHDRLALGLLAECFPDRKVTGIHAVDLVWGFGTLHCLTHEVPAS